jgi:ornithine cyclodeaminase/alanine dehydrogenase-like protein (mu-crystallin family)
MALLLTESDVRKILTMEMALRAVEDSFKDLGDGTALLHPRRRLHVPGGSYLHYMAAADTRNGYMGMKIYTSSKTGLRFLVPLFHSVTGDLLALVEADYLGQVRTGAASGVATRLLSRKDSHTVGLIGTGSQAHTQLQSIVQVRKIDRIRVYGRNAEKRAAFAQEASAAVKVKVEGVGSGEEAVRDADIIVTSTTASEPVLEGKWLRPGVHINAIGANFPQKRELDADAVGKATVIAVDSCEQSKMEAGDLIQAFGNDASRWDAVKELAQIAVGKAPGRVRPEDITLFKSNGIAAEDIATAGKIYERAKEMGIGTGVPMWPSERPAAR